MDIESTPRRTAGTWGRAWAEPLLVTLAFMFPGLVPAAAPASMATTDWLVSGAVQSIAQFVLLLVIIGASGHLRDYGVRRPRAADFLQAAVLCGIILVLSRLAAALAALAGYGTAGVAPFLPQPPNTPPALTVTLSALFALAVAYREELLYRLYIIGSLRGRGAGAVAAVLVSTLAFAVGHGWQGLPGIVSALLIGAALGVAAVRGCRLHALALAHAAYDFGVLLAAFGLLG
jgi:membrane protease YdiL (CAAX protease family)